MKLSNILIEYRKRMQISQRQFARQCGLSNSYISFLENEVNPKTGRPLTPTLEIYKNLADGMNMTVQQLFDLLDDDAPVILNSLQIPVDSLTEPEHQLIVAYRAADVRARVDALELLLNHPQKKGEKTVI